MQAQLLARHLRADNDIYPLGSGADMLVLVTYDVRTNTPAGRARLRRVARVCEDWAQRVQYSVFECEFAPAQWTCLRATLLSTIDANAASLRFYFMGREWRRRVEHMGRQTLNRSRRFADRGMRTPSGQRYLGGFAS